MGALPAVAVHRFSASSPRRHIPASAPVHRLEVPMPGLYPGVYRMVHFAAISQKPVSAAEYPRAPLTGAAESRLARLHRPGRPGARYRIIPAVAVSKRRGPAVWRTSGHLGCEQTPAPRGPIWSKIRPTPPSSRLVKSPSGPHLSGLCIGPRLDRTPCRFRQPTAEIGSDRQALAANGEVKPISLRIRAGQSLWGVRREITQHRRVKLFPSPISL